MSRGQAAPRHSWATCLADGSPSRCWLPLQAWTRATERSGIPGRWSQGFPGQTGVASGQLEWESSKTSCPPSHLGRTALGLLGVRLRREVPARPPLPRARVAKRAERALGCEVEEPDGADSRDHSRVISKSHEVRVRSPCSLISETGITIRLREIIMSNSTRDTLLQVTCSRKITMLSKK